MSYQEAIEATHKVFEGQVEMKRGAGASEREITKDLYYRTGIALTQAMHLEETSRALIYQGGDALADVIIKIKKYG